MPKDHFAHVGIDNGGKEPIINSPRLVFGTGRGVGGAGENWNGAAQLFGEVIELVQKAYVLIKVEVGKAETVAHALAGLTGVREVDLVMGPDDVIVTLEKEDAEKIARTVLTDVSRVSGVLRTSTYLVVPLDSEPKSTASASGQLIP